MEYTKVIVSIAANPHSSVPRVWSLYPVFTFIPDIWVTTQKKLSFTWDTIIAPEQRAVTRIAFSRGETNPITPISGATMDAVVIDAIDI